VIAEKSIAIVQNFTVTDGKGEQAAMPGRCPHCGAVFAGAAANGEDRESLRA
jgi:hypothetical protein